MFSFKFVASSHNRGNFYKKPIKMICCCCVEVKGRLGILEWRRHFTRNRVEQRSYKRALPSTTNHQASSRSAFNQSINCKQEKRDEMFKMFSKSFINLNICNHIFIILDV